VRVRIEQTGVCHSDLSLARGVLAQPLPAVLGHAARGTVVEVGADVTNIADGQRVILLWITPCGSCFHCAHGEPHLCVTGAQRAGEPYAVTEQGARLAGATPIVTVERNPEKAELARTAGATDLVRQRGHQVGGAPAHRGPRRRLPMAAGRGIRTIVAPAVPRKF
jgi:Zn-dependent alcohol dehydrogenase